MTDLWSLHSRCCLQRRSAISHVPTSPSWVMPVQARLCFLTISCLAAVSHREVKRAWAADLFSPSTCNCALVGTWGCFCSLRNRTALFCLLRCTCQNTFLFVCFLNTSAFYHQCSSFQSHLLHSWLSISFLAEPPHLLLACRKHKCCASSRIKKGKEKWKQWLFHSLRQSLQ